MPLTETRTAFKPFEYPWAYEAYQLQNKIHWIPEEVPLHEDVADWKTKLTPAEKNLITQILRFFTQADHDVCTGYLDRYIPHFKAPEIRMMLTTFAAMEVIHIDAYSLLIDTVGLPDTEYEAFLKYQEMSDKHEYMFKELQTTQDRKIALDLAKFSAFGEGLQLFASFIILLNFTRFGKMRGMGQIVNLSVKDETWHCENMIKLFHAFIDENPHLWTDHFKKHIYQTCRDMVDLEDRFIDLAFEQGGIEGLDKDEVKEYIRYIADRRLLQLNLKPNYKVKDNPLPWVEELLNGVEHANFFESRATEYSKGNLKGDWF